MSWELGYLCGLLSGAALAGLVGVFLHAQSWADWGEAFDAMKATACDWRNRFGAESERAAILDAKFGTLADDLAGCRRHNADAAAVSVSMSASMAEADARADDTGRHRDSLRAELLEAAKAAAAMTLDLEAARLDLADSGESLDVAMVHLQDAVNEGIAARKELADTHKSLDAAMAHVEQLVLRRDAGIVERDALLAQVRGMHEAVQAVTDSRNDAAARADASNARCQHAFRDRAKTHQKMREIIALTDALRAEANS